jgi:ribosomal protection tetracycline resistance protein
MKFKNNIINIGIVAHVDAGKTTLTEQLIYQSGSCTTLGSVDKGTTHTDSLELEKQRGISIKASEIDINWKGKTIYIIDTPGHMDFSGEVERSIAVLDGAIVMISSVESVQPQTEVYFNALKELNKPAVFFVNKLDRIGSSVYKTLADMKKLLSKQLIPLQIVSITENGSSLVNLFNEFSEETTVDKITSAPFAALIEEISETLGDNNEDILQMYFDGSLTLKKIKYEIVIQCRKGIVYPVFFGSALKGEGIKELLCGILDYLPSPKDLDNEELSAFVYKISHHKTLGKMAHIKLFSGKIESRDEILNISTNKREKITVIKKLINGKQQDVKSAKSGDLVMVSGLNCSIYDILGSSTYVPKLYHLANALLTLKVYPKNEEDYLPLTEALNILQEEDPLLNMQWVKEKKEIHIQIMGKIQLEVIESVLKERFNIEVTFGQPSVIYKETPAERGYGEEHYTMPKPCWAIVTFLIEPLPLGSGIVYESIVRTEKVKLKYQKEIEDNLHRILTQGIHGWNVTDLKITFTEGEDHVMHSRSGDFAAASEMAIMRGLNTVGTILLEPILKFRITVPEEIGGKVLNDIIQMRGTFENPSIHNGVFTLEGKLPAAASLEYPVDLSIISSGRSVMATQFAGFEPCPEGLGADRERIGVNPLDRSKFILYVRNAL